jgi:hypothetical protein
MAVLLVGAAVISKVRPALAEAAKVAIEALRIGLIVTLAAVICAAATWIIIRVIRWRIHRDQSKRSAPTCPACDDSGEVLWTSRDGELKLLGCAGCQTTRQAG